MEELDFLVIGIDSMSHWMKFSWPRGFSIYKCGCFKTIKEICLTGPNWISIYTGVPPEIHGITEGGWLEGDQTWVDSKAPTIWEKLIAAGKRVGLMTMPMTYPIMEGFEWLVCGFPVPETRDDYYSPPDIKNLKPPYFEVDWLNQDWSRISWDRGIRDIMREPLQQKRLRDIAWAKVRYFKDLVEWSEPEIAGIGFTFIDRVHHCFLNSSLECLFMYEVLERIIKDLVEFAGAKTKVLVISDHGSSPAQTYRGFWHDESGILALKNIDFTPSEGVCNCVASTILERELL